MTATPRVRFAPSPTGDLHVGGVRTALYNWLYARRHGGTFVLRVEDTDQARSTEESTRAILDGMAWLGMHADEGPFFQSARTPLYRAKIDELHPERRLGREVLDRPEDHPARREAARLVLLVLRHRRHPGAVDLREAEVDDLHQVAFSEHHVPRLEVAVHDAPLVDLGEGDRDLPRDQRITWTTAPDRLGRRPLQESGLIGPVIVVTD